MKSLNASSHKIQLFTPCILTTLFEMDQNVRMITSSKQIPAARNSKFATVFRETGLLVVKLSRQRKAVLAYGRDTDQIILIVISVGQMSAGGPWHSPKHQQK